MRVDANDYSVDPAVIGRRVEVVADLDHGHGHLRRRVVVAAHARCWARHQTITDPAHRAAAQRAGPPRSRGQGPPTSRPADRPVEVEQRDLAVYDACSG